MNLNHYTQKSLEAVQSARDLAVANGHQQMEQIHMLTALLRQENGLTAGHYRRKSGSSCPGAAAEAPLCKGKPGG